jgi:DNA helicase-2/ATP-dependent DNA helicase PcrA
MHFLEHVIAAGELAQQGLISLALHRVLRSLRTRKGTPLKPFTGTGFVSEIQKRGCAVALLSFIASRYSALNTSSLLDFYQSLSGEITQHLNGIALQKILSGKIKAFAQSTPYNSLSSTVRLTEEKRIIRTIHQAKGAEFDNILVYFSQGDERVRHMLLPLDYQDEEARISFVAFSRARNRLFITFPKLSISDQNALQELGIEVKIFH